MGEVGCGAGADAARAAPFGDDIAADLDGDGRGLAATLELKTLAFEFLLSNPVRLCLLEIGSTLKVRSLAATIRAVELIAQPPDELLSAERTGYLAANVRPDLSG